MHDQTSKKSNWGKVGKVAVIFFTCIVCIASIAYIQTDVPKAAATYENNRNAALSAGLYFDRDSVATLYRVPDEENAATILQASLEKLTDYDVAGDIAKLSDTSFLKKWKELEPDFEKIDLGCQKNRLILKHPNRDVTTGTTSFGMFRYWTQVMIRRARLASAENDFELSKRLILTSSKLAVLTDDEPEIMAILLRVVSASIIEKAIRELILLRGKEPRWQELILQAIQILDQPYDLKPFLKRSHWWAMQEYESMTKGEWSGGLGVSVKLLCTIPRYKSACLSRIHEFYAQAMTNYPTDLYDYAALQKQCVGLEAYNSQEGLTMFPIAVLLQNFPNVILSLHAETTNRSAIAQAVHLLQDRRDPSKGLPLSGRFANDIDGKPLRIKKKDDHWIVYSVGKDRVDDGGTEIAKEKGDVVVHLPK